MNRKQSLGLIVLAILMLIVCVSCADTTVNVDDAAVTSTPDTKAPDEIDEIIAEMTIEEKVGQMFFVRCPDVNATEDVKTYHLGGYVLFGRDFDGLRKDEVTKKIQSYQDAADIPLLIGVDEEGGTVVRVSANKNLVPDRFLSPQQLYKKGGLDAVITDAKNKAEVLYELGINMNLAPVCDVSTNESDFIYDRSFGQPAEKTAEYVQAVVMAMKDKNVASCLKHFPGYGNNVDTHTGIAYDQRPIEEFKSSDFLPFIAGIENGADAVLVSHNVVSAMDPYLPASLSAPVHQILRDELLFDGVIITDDLVMAAIGEYATENEAAVLSVLAGNDLILSTDYRTQIPSVIQAVQNGRITTERLDESVRRILVMKKNLGLY